MTRHLNALLLAVAGVAFAVPSGPQASECLQSPSGLLSWWRGEGDGNDIQGSSPGSLANGVTFAPGMVGQAFSFDGVDDVVRVSSVANLEVQRLTVDAWVLGGPASDVIGGIIATKDIGDTSFPPFTSWSLTGPGTTGKFHVFVGFTDGSHPQLTSTSSFSSNQFHHVAMTWDGTAIALYVDGQLEGTLNVGAKTISYNGDALTIGNHALVLRPHHGIIDEIDFYNRALSPGEIQATFLAGYLGKCRPCIEPQQGIVSWWPGDGTSHDIQGSSAGSLANGVAFAPGMVGQAFSFDGVDDVVRVQNVATLEVQRLTVDAWVLGGPASDVIGGIIATKDIGDTSFPPFTSWSLTGPGTTGKFHVFVGFTDGSHPQLTSTSSFSSNQFHHVAMTWDGAAIALYVDGQLEGTLNVGAKTISYNGDALTIGNHALVLRPHAGIIDEIDVYDRALLPLEINAIYQPGGSGKCKVDTDGDSVTDGQDNCPSVPNPSQLDTDMDDLGDDCDPDDDNDGAQDAQDNCALVSNAGQLDSDLDGSGDACDPDDDNDGTLDGLDNCPIVHNPNQADLDADSIGDACDVDIDGDGSPNTLDCAPTVRSFFTSPGQVGNSLSFESTSSGSFSWLRAPQANVYNVYRGTSNAIPLQYNHDCLEAGSANLAFTDSTTPALGAAYYYLVSAVNSCAEGILGTNAAGAMIPNPEPCVVTSADIDGDSVSDINDNCPHMTNASQLDSDNDGAGDECDCIPMNADLNDTCILSSEQFGLYAANRSDGADTHAWLLQNGYSVLHAEAAPAEDGSLALYAAYGNAAGTTVYYVDNPQWPFDLTPAVHVTSGGALNVFQRVQGLRIVDGEDPVYLDEGAIQLLLSSLSVSGTAAMSPQLQYAPDATCAAGWHQFMAECAFAALGATHCTHLPEIMAACITSGFVPPLAVGCLIASAYLVYECYHDVLDVYQCLAHPSYHPPCQSTGSCTLTSRCVGSYCAPSSSMNEQTPCEYETACYDSENAIDRTGATCEPCDGCNDGITACTLASGFGVPCFTLSGELCVEPWGCVPDGYSLHALSPADGESIDVCTGPYPEVTVFFNGQPGDPRPPVSVSFYVDGQLLSEIPVLMGPFEMQVTVVSPEAIPYTIGVGDQFEVSAAVGQASILSRAIGWGPTQFQRWAGNGHCYSARLAPGLTWTEAQASCQEFGGYLATMTSGGENEHIKQLFEDNAAFWFRDGFSNLLGPWTGGVQAAGSVEPDGGWGWATGEPFVFSDWGADRPDNCCSNQNRIIYTRRGLAPPSSWDDVQHFTRVPRGFICEIGN